MTHTSAPLSIKGGERPRHADDRATARVDRLFALALSLSLAGHALVFAAQLVFPGWMGMPQPPKPLHLIYEHETKQDASQWTQEELHRVASRLKEVSDPSHAPAQDAEAGSHEWDEKLQGALASGLSNMEPQIKIGEAGDRMASAMTFGDSGSWAAAIDLTNVTAAAQGNPVLLSYFSAIRERIQHTANQRAWLPMGERAGGVVYVGFAISRSGDIQSASVVSDRSVDSPLLRETALHIIESSSPFLPFPPSLQDPSKTVVVPIEFSLGP